jgi:hypothetical protein
VLDIAQSTGLLIKPHVAPEHRLAGALEQYFDMPVPWRYTESYEEEVAPEDVQAELDKPIQAIPYAEALRNLESADRGKLIPRTILEYAANGFERAVLFMVRNDRLIGFDGFSPPRRKGFAEGYEIDLNAPSLFADLVRGGARHMGPLPEREVEENVVELLGGGMPKSAFIAAVTLRGRVVNVFYGDNGPAGETTRDMGDFFLLLNKVAHAYDRLIKIRLRASLTEK